jgi:hypothetical protein
VTTILSIPMLMILAVPAVPAGHARYVPHVRVRHAALEPLLRESIERSATVRRMVATLDASDIVVYLDVQAGMPRSLPAGIVYAGTGGSFRYLRIWLNPANTRSEMLTMIGHELQHAVEVAGAAEVRSARTLQRFYRRIGLAGGLGETWDTHAAREAGRQVAREITRDF